MTITFTPGILAVVTTGTGGGHQTVIEARRQPGDSAVTVFTFLTGHANMVTGHSGRRAAVMAHVATAHHGRMIHVRIGKRHGGVTIVTFIIGTNMAPAFACGDTAVVTTRTGARRPFEHPFQMTVGAFQHFMLAGKNEPCRKMIKITTRHNRISALQRAHQHDKNHQI